MSNVLDANCWAKYIDDIIFNGDGSGLNLIDKIDANGGYVVDDIGLIKHEYLNVRTPHAEALYNEWFGQRSPFGIVRISEQSRCGKLRSMIRELGVPNKDAVYIKVAVQSGVNHIISDDIDMFDPKSKSKSSAAREKIIDDESGDVCIKLWRNYRIIVRSSSNYLIHS